MARHRFVRTLTATTVATYLLIALGASVIPSDGSVLLARIHHAAAILVGILLLGTAWQAWIESLPTRVRIAIAVVVGLYPVQAGVGAASVTGFATVGPNVHLWGAMVIFSTLLVSLVWTLEADVERTPRQAVDRPVTPPDRTSELDEAGSDRQASFDGQTDSDRQASFDGQTDSNRQDRMSARWGTLNAYVSLTKPRLMWLLCLLAIAGMALAAGAGHAIDGPTVVVTLFGGVLAVGASGTFNQVYERDRDRQMQRTHDRPLAVDRVSPHRAVLFGISLAVIGLGSLWLFINPLASLLTAVAIVYYSVVYTVVLKPHTTLNISIGGGSGALPAVIGWAAVTGSIDLPALLLAAIVVLWTPAHFYNLAIACRDDYSRAGYPMLPSVRGVEVTRRRIVWWFGATLLATSALAAVADFGITYAVLSVLAAGAFLWTIVRQYEEQTDSAAYRSFYASNAYLGVVLVGIVIETVLL